MVVFYTGVFRLQHDHAGDVSGQRGHQQDGDHDEEGAAMPMNPTEIPVTPSRPNTIRNTAAMTKRLSMA